MEAYQAPMEDYLLNYYLLQNQKSKSHERMVESKT